MWWKQPGQCLNLFWKVTLEFFSENPFTRMTIFFPFIFISWRLITLQYCSGFCYTLAWISHGFTCRMTSLRTIQTQFCPEAEQWTQTPTKLHLEVQVCSGPQSSWAWKPVPAPREGSRNARSFWLFLVFRVKSVAWNKLENKTKLHSLNKADINTLWIYIHREEVATSNILKFQIR